MILFFCFKQKTAYEMRISDWSSDVCSSDLMLIENIRAQRADIERLTEASHQAGDQTIAERLAEQIVDIDEVLPRLINLIAIPGTTDPLLPDSKNPGRAERGMRIVYLETVKMLDDAKHDLANSRSKKIGRAHV